MSWSFELVNPNTQLNSPTIETHIFEEVQSLQCGHLHLGAMSLRYSNTFIVVLQAFIVTRSKGVERCLV
ncbi:MAG: hypothetical protein DRJ49_07310 [Thermoprotei archaeon]|nr:MAG: hypothetical protein DRJ49_07310 [Thermoprotei archaeon]